MGTKAITGNAGQTERELTTVGIFQGAGIGAAVAALGNVLVFFVATFAGVSMVAEFMKGEPPAPLGVGAVIMASFVPAFGAGLLTLILNRATAKASKILLGISVAVGLLSLMGPATLPGASVGLRGVLVVMHLIAGIAIPAGILRFAKRFPHADG